MGRVPITLMGFRCERCEHEWIPKGAESEPKTCPKCRSPYWDRPRKKGAMMTYEEFKDTIERTLRKDRELTWTEIRTKAKLPQKWPNNQWVHRLERDIGLERPHDGNTIKWRLGTRKLV